MASNQTRDVYKVIPAFLAGAVAQGRYTKSGLDGYHGVRLSTDGVTLWSYKLPIAKRRVDGLMVKIDVIRRESAPTSTTKRHLSALNHALYEDGTFEVQETDKL